VHGLAAMSLHKRSLWLGDRGREEEWDDKEGSIWDWARIAWHGMEYLFDFIFAAELAGVRDAEDGEMHNLG
jgi:hypothetical protein